MDLRDVDDNVGYSRTQGRLLLDNASVGEYIERINRVVKVMVVDWTDDDRVECRGSECVHNVVSPSLGMYNVRSKTQQILHGGENAKNLPTQKSLFSDTP